MSTATPAKGEFVHERILKIPIRKLIPSPENDRLYRPIDSADPDIAELADSIAEIGVQEPLVVTADYFVVSGHRRLVAAKRARLPYVPCQVLNFDKDDDPDRFMQLLRECNRQRVKTFAETLREQAIDADPEVAYQSLIEHRQAQADVQADTIDLKSKKGRPAISKAKEPFLQAAKNVIADLKEYWPLSDRMIHYVLLNNPPLKHASKPDSVYVNDDVSYRQLTELLTRARVAGLIPMDTIADETRPVTTWGVHADVGSYLRKEMYSFGRGYWRDLMQSQPNHIEIIGEKNTIKSIIEPVAMRYCIPCTISRGFSSLPPRYGIAQRYFNSGKDMLVLLILSDLDPDGDSIAESLARSLRDDFEIEHIVPIKVALTAGLVAELGLPPGPNAKKGSPRHKEFIKRYGSNTVWELEAIQPAKLQEILQEEIDSVIDIEAFNYEVDREKEDAAKLEGVREIVIDVLREYEE